MEILRNYSIGKNEKTWATAIRDLITIGKPAVPELIAELDRTERPQTLSALGFALRGISDPQAVPALIRAVPRLYPSGGGDFGLRIQGDPELTKFMLEHDNYPKEYPRYDKATFSYGRSIREIMFITKESICGAIQIQSPLSRKPVPGMPAPRTGGWHYKFIYERTRGAEE